MVAPIAKEIEVTSPKYRGVGFAVMFVITITIATGIYAVISSLQIFTNKISSLGILIGILVSLIFPLLLPVSEKIKELVESWNANRERLRVYHSTVEEKTNNGEKTDNIEDKEGVEDSREIEGVGVREEIWSEVDAEKNRFLVIFLCLLSRSNNWFGVS